MFQRPFSSVTEQVAESLREGIRQRRWNNEMPGRLTLSRELGVNHKTIETALYILEKSGWVERQGLGKGRRIIQRKSPQSTSLKIVMLVYEESDLQTGYLVELLHRFQSAGHDASFGSKTLRGLGMNVNRVAQFVRRTEADAWIVLAGSSEIIEWFGKQSFPTLALFGRIGQAAVASCVLDKATSCRRMVRRLVELGHRRIVLLARSERRLPVPGAVEQLFLNLLAEHQISTSSYNLPHWEDTPEDFHRCLDRLFRNTPPTALILDEPLLFIAAQQHLAQAGVIAPRDISLICTNPCREFEWCRPAIAHIQWDPAPMIRRVIGWANHVSHSKEDRRKTNIRSELFEGGTIGPAPRSALLRPEGSK